MSSSGWLDSDKNMIDCGVPHPKGTCTAQPEETKLWGGDAIPTKKKYILYYQ